MGTTIGVTENDWIALIDKNGDEITCIPAKLVFSLWRFAIREYEAKKKSAALR